MKKQYLIPQVDTVVLSTPLCHIEGSGITPPPHPGTSAPVRGAAGKLYI
ncbi:MAG: hypothetical protein MJZ79_02250 [Paludibacteraceae bacterium]|nr:hypothetical protein [Paludibacteraceae bacterium]